ncbi:hypothetical protein [Anaerotruncus rubiinfantis]|uniref:hypothetical protein n=1 Tax=Anaerotruncus rubiinfantis TaxID=1720200 RepID=UPI0034A17B7D
MTIDKAVAIIQQSHDNAVRHELEDTIGRRYGDIAQAFAMALEALREKAARENPEPLTLEELRQMDGEPVWCCSCLNGRSEWAILRAVEMSKTWFVALGGATQGFGDKDTYGKTWLAYREKPKEG